MPTGTVAYGSINLVGSGGGKIRWKDGFNPRSAYRIGSPLCDCVRSSHDVFILHALRLSSICARRKRVISRVAFGKPELVQRFNDTCNLSF